MPQPSLRLITAGEKSDTFTALAGAPNEVNTLKGATVKTIPLSDGMGHEACNQTIDKLLRLVASQRELLESTTASLKTAVETIAILNSVMALMPPAKTEKRGRGAPKKRTNDLALLEIFNSTVLPEFQAANSKKDPSDLDVLTWYFEKEFKRYGQRASRARDKEFQSKLKTFKNRLSDVRNMRPKLPIK